MNYFKYGVKSMLPIIPGVIPFGLIMGTVAVEAGLNNLQIGQLNIFVFAGASQLAAVELLSNGVSAFIIILTGLIINLRFILYSAAFAPIVKNSSFLVKSATAYLLTDQSYAVSVAKEKELSTNKQRLNFFFGNALCMSICWHISVALGVLFGNFAPKSISLDFAVPLSFMALTIPTLISKNHIYVAFSSSVLACILYSLPFNLGLMVTGMISISLAAFLTRRKI